jgi:hypothetical protein
MSNDKIVELRDEIKGYSSAMDAALADEDRRY